MAFLAFSLLVIFSCCFIPSLSVGCTEDFIYLTSSNATFTFSSTDDRYCIWNFKGDATEGQFVLTLEEFNLKGKDVLAVKRSRLEYPKYIFESSNYLATSYFHKDRMYLAFRNHESSSFKAKVKWVRDSDMCYNVKDKGQSYDGTVDFTADRNYCMPWIKALSCQHNPLSYEDVSDNLVAGFCRNPDNSERPWCYVAECEKRYCDVCFLEEPVDERSDCDYIKRMGHCVSYSAKCLKTCQVAKHKNLKKVSSITCDQPESVPGGVFQGTPKTSYGVGEKVVYNCSQGGFPVTRTCLSSGEWTVAHTACLACPEGFTQFQGNCYKYMDLLYNYANAEKKCQEFGSRVATPKNEAENSFINSISFGVKNQNKIWLGGYKHFKKQAFYWNDNTPISWTAWRDRTSFRKAQTCMNMLPSKQWKDHWCFDKISFVCTTESFSKPACKDFLDNCPNLLAVTGKPTCEAGSSLETYCRSTCGLCPRDCGETFSLSRSNPSRTITTDRWKQSDRFCTWTFNGDKTSSGRFVVVVEKLDVKSFQGECVETLEMSDSLNGKPLKRLCNSNKEVSFELDKHQLFINFRTLANSNSHFTAKVTWVYDEDTCYNVEDKGWSYNGDMNYTVAFKACLPWAKALGCPHNPLEEEDFLDNLDGNFCRNPDESDRPWCYVSDTCERQYCDVCRLHKVIDVSNTCGPFKSRGLCTSDPKRALEECAATCKSVSTQPEPSVKNVHCKKPKAAIWTGEVVETLKESYEVGEIVTYKCYHAPSVTKSVCMTDGQWSDAGTACFACPIGWAAFNNRCYRLVDKFLGYSDAEKECEKLEAKIARGKTQEVNNFLAKFVPRNDDIWMGARKNNSINEFIWNDGTLIDPYFWYNEEKMAHRDPCITMSVSGSWNDDWCEDKFFSFVCEQKHDADDFEECEDVTDKCPERITLAEDGKCDAILDKFCHHSCTGCGRIP